MYGSEHKRRRRIVKYSFGEMVQDRFHGLRGVVTGHLIQVETVVDGRIVQHLLDESRLETIDQNIEITDGAPPIIVRDEPPKVTEHGAVPSKAVFSKKGLAKVFLGDEAPVIPEKPVSKAVVKKMDAKKPVKTRAEVKKLDVKKPDTGKSTLVKTPPTKRPGTTPGGRHSMTERGIIRTLAVNKVANASRPISAKQIADEIIKENIMNPEFQAQVARNKLPVSDIVKMALYNACNVNPDWVTDEPKIERVRPGIFRKKV
jgi:hypothetical protein